MARTIKFYQYSRGAERVTVAESADIAVMEVQGDGMHPTFRDGQSLIYSTAAAAFGVGDGIYVVRLDGVVMVKRLQRLPGGRVRVISDNHRYRPYILDAAADFAVLGRPIYQFSRV